MESVRKSETMADKLGHRTQLGNRLEEILKLDSTRIVGYQQKLNVEKALKAWVDDQKP